MTKNVIAIIAAPIVWGLVMFPGNLIILQFFPEAATGTFTTGYLFAALIGSFVYSFASGAAAAWIAQPDFARIGVYAGLALLAVGAVVQALNWELGPAWYHLAFLFWLIPLCMAGANVARGMRKPAA